MIVIYAVIGSYWALTTLATSLSYGQRHDITFGNVRSCCNPCYCSVLYIEHEMKKNERYIQESGYSKDRIQEMISNKHCCCEKGCITKLCQFNIITKEVLWSTLAGVALFFMFVFYVC